MRIGVIGIRSKHLNFFRQALSLCFPGGEHTITHICGCDAPEILSRHPDLIHCDSPAALMDAVDAVIIATREGYTHAALARLSMEKGKPVFVDKPFTCDIDEAEAIRKTAAETGVPCTGGSTIALTQTVQQLKKKLPHCAEYSISYMADPFSPFGGWYFYGSHLTDLCVTLFGDEWQGLSASIDRDRIAARIQYPGFSVVLRSSPEVQPFLFTADRDYILDDVHCYEAGMRHFCAAAEGQEPGCTDTLVSSVRLMDAILAAVREAPPCCG